MVVRQSVRFGRIAGIDVGAHWTVLVIAALLAWGLYRNVLPAGAPGATSAAYSVAAILVAVAFMVCLLAHEMAHALVARHYGIGVRRITLWLLGGVSELEAEAKTPRADFAIAGAGPATSLAIGIAGAGAAVASDLFGWARLLTVCLVWLAAVNLILGVFNLLPGAPLDGGRVLRAIIWKVRGDRAAAQAAADRAGIGLGAILAGVGVVEIFATRDASGIWLVLLGWFLIAAASAESAGARLRTALTGRTVADIMTPDPVLAYGWQSVSDFVDLVARSARRRTFPVVDFDGRFTGIVTLGQLAAVPAEARATTRVDSVITPAARLAVVDPATPAETAATQLTAARPVIGVVSAGRLIGTLTRDDLERAIELAGFGPSRDQVRA